MVWAALALFFVILPISHTQYLGDYYTVIKWILAFLGIGILTIALKKTREFIFPSNKKLTIFFLLLVVLKLVALLFNFNILALENILETGIFAILLFGFYQLLQKKEFFDEVSRLTLLGLIPALGYICVQFFQSRILQGNTYHELFFGSFGNINMAGEYLLFSLPLVERALQTEQNKIWKNLSRLMFPLIIIIIYFIQSRSILLGTSLYLVASFLFYKEKKEKIILLALATIVIGSLEFSHSSLQNEATAKAKENSTSYRKEMAQETFQMSLAKVFGWGLGSYEFGFAPYKMSGDIPLTEDIVDKSPHNEFLRWGMETGWVYSLLAVLFFLLLYFYNWNKEAGLYLLVLAPQILFQFPFENAQGFVWCSFVIALSFYAFEKKTVSLKQSLFIILGTLITLHSIRFATSRYLEFNHSYELAPSKLSCILLPSNWRGCGNYIANTLRSNNFEEANRLSRAELIKRPYNFVALKYWIITLTNQNKTEQACRAIAAYDILFSKHSSLSVNRINDCKSTLDHFVFSNPKKFDEDYLDWLKKEQVL